MQYSYVDACFLKEACMWWHTCVIRWSRKVKLKQSSLRYYASVPQVVHEVWQVIFFFILLFLPQIWQRLQYILHRECVWWCRLALGRFLIVFLLITQWEQIQQLEMGEARTDIVWLSHLQFPVRCARCVVTSYMWQRYMNLSTALMIHSENITHLTALPFLQSL